MIISGEKMKGTRFVLYTEDTAGIKYFSVFDQYSTAPVDGWIEYPNGSIDRYNIVIE